ncbi:hypothetical protein ABVV53_05700 [Novosphingobium sp. RD2P27]|uniref:Uncharacterized protein n=1 Tax=Novosphingobium kalidii TaxID=3230299 RepID=A0ABV2CZC4_9SPHN
MRGRVQDARRRKIIGSAIVILLTMPFVAMQFTREVTWTASDFGAAAFLLALCALTYELFVRRIANRRTRGITITGLLGGLLVIWADGAVGVF